MTTRRDFHLTVRFRPSRPTGTTLLLAILPVALRLLDLWRSRR